MDAESPRPGPRLDARVAQRILGLPDIPLDARARCPRTGGEMRLGIGRAWCHECREWHASPYKDYSTEIADAWEVLAAMAAASFSVRRRFYHALQREAAEPGLVPAWPDALTVLIRRGTFPLAICRAALAALDDEDRGAPLPGP